MNKYDKEILKVLIECCLTINPKKILPTLKNNMFVTNMPNKMRFYSHFKYMLNCLNCNSNKILNYKWTKIYWMGRPILSLEIYDSIHKYARLTFLIDKKNDKILIETLPF